MTYVSNVESVMCRWIKDKYIMSNVILYGLFKFNNSIRIHHCKLVVGSIVNDLRFGAEVEDECWCIHHSLTACLLSSLVLSRCVVQCVVPCFLVACLNISVIMPLGSLSANARAYGTYLESWVGLDIYGFPL